MAGKHCAVLSFAKVVSGASTQQSQQQSTNEDTVANTTDNNDQPNIEQNKVDHPPVKIAEEIAQTNSDDKNWPSLNELSALNIHPEENDMQTKIVKKPASPSSSKVVAGSVESSQVIFGYNF